jgi:stress response protein YsnF
VAVEGIEDPTPPVWRHYAGYTEQAISRGFELAVAAVFEDLTDKTDHLEMLRQIIDLASKTPPNLMSTAVSSGQLTNPKSAIIAGGKRLLSSLFGNRENALLASMSRESGLGTGAASTVLVVAAQSVLTFLGTRVRNAVGSAAVNLKLSQDRATNVMQELVNLGISRGRLSAQGYGDEHAVGDTSTDEQGTTRIRRFVTEKPVEAKVTLHEEHAQVVRRAVSDPPYVQDIDWSDQTVEVLETAEQAVVSKSSHIAEEVVVGKTGSDHVETIKDTVRRQQVEVERVPSTSVTGKP